jgi:drug/metabolite transporter, DME family
MAHPKRGRILVLVAALLWSTSGFFAKAPIWEAWPIADRGVLLAFWRATFAALALLPFIRSPRWSWGLIPAGVCFAAMNGMFLHAMTLTTEANALWLQYTCPLWVYLIGTIVFHEHVHPRDRGMLAGVLAGVGVILISEWIQAAVTPLSFQGSLWGLGAGLGLAGVMLSLKHTRSMDAVWVIVFCHAVAAAAMLPLLPKDHFIPSRQQLPWLFAFGALQMAMPYILFYRGIRLLPSHEASCLALLEPILVSLWVFMAWGGNTDYVPPALSTWCGGGLILAGLLWRYWPRSP